MEMTTCADDSDHDATEIFDRNVTLVGKNRSMSRTIGRICDKFDMLFSQRAYVHWFVSEGMEEGDFAKAREDLGFLKKDYFECYREMTDDEEAEDTESDAS